MVLRWAIQVQMLREVANLQPGGNWFLGKS